MAKRGDGSLSSLPVPSSAVVSIDGDIGLQSNLLQLLPTGFDWMWYTRLSHFYYEKRRVQALLHELTLRSLFKN